MGEPIPFPKGYKGPGPDQSDALIKELHETYLNEISILFNKYKAIAGKPDAVLEIL